MEVGAMAKKKAGPASVTVNVTLQTQRGVEQPKARAYLFDRSGALIQSELLSGKPLELQLADQSVHRLVVGPDVPVKERSPFELSAELTRARAISRDINPRALAPIAISIPPSIYTCWWQTCIYVHGSVRKQTAPGVYAPICVGVVQIFQVDLACTLDQLASFTDLGTWYTLLIDALAGIDRQLLLERIRTVPNLPDPPPDSVAIARPLARALLQTPKLARTLAPKTLAAAPRFFRASSATSVAASAAELRAASAGELATSLRSLPLDARRDVIVANKAIIAPYLCWLIPDDWFCWQELGEAQIQSDGTFSAEVCFWCPTDFPDLYFEVVQTIGGIEREVSDPQIACSTYYGYDGNTDVVITVDDPTAIACNDPAPPPIPGGAYYVWPTAIGNQDLRGIVGLEAAPGPAPYGLLGASPWGGTLALQMEFDPRLKTDNIAFYYRWSYQFWGDSGFTPITAPVNHRYKTVTGVLPNINIHLTTVNLGPQTVGAQQNLFAIPDPFPSDGWVNIDDPWDRPFAYFDSTNNHYSPFSYTDLSPRRSGLCTLMLEIFDATGNLVSCANNALAGPFVFVLPDLTKSPGNYTSTLGPNNITPSGQLLFHVLIDNNDTYAHVDGVTAGGNTADACGMLHYTALSDPVGVTFHALHPNGYLNWQLEVWGGSPLRVLSTSGSSNSAPPTGTDPFTNPASALLGSCTDAAFAANLWSDATATDGYTTQTQYNRFTSFPFALLTP
jgi:hypothetical protein